jgi:hypothetical protein
MVGVGIIAYRTVGGKRQASASDSRERASEGLLVWPPGPHHAPRSVGACYDYSSFCAHCHPPCTLFAGLGFQSLTSESLAISLLMASRLSAQQPTRPRTPNQPDDKKKRRDREQSAELIALISNTLQYKVVRCL